MASAYKNIVTTVGSTGDVTVYTCPAATVAMVKDINLYNSHTGSIVVLCKITDSSASATVTLQKCDAGYVSLHLCVRRCVLLRTFRPGDR